VALPRCEGIEGVMDRAPGHGGGVAIVIVEPGDVVVWNHQIPADQGERGGVAGLHGLRSSRGDQKTEGVAEEEPGAVWRIAREGIVPLRRPKAIGVVRVV
jgi:hypothetical protein